MKRKSLAAAAVLGGLVLSGCAGTAEPESGGGLTWSMWIGSSEDQKAWEAVGASGSEASGQTVSLQGSPFADYWTKLSTQLGTADAPCIVSMQSLRLNQFVDGLLPLDDLLADADVDLSEFDEGALTALAFDGEQYALPYDNGPVILFYNRDAFASAGVAEPEPGWSTDEFEDAAEKLQQAGLTAFASTAEDIFLEGTLFAFNGAEMIASGGELNLEDPAVAEAVEWVAGLVEDGLSTRANGPDATADENAFIGGSAAMVAGGPWLVLDLASKADFELGITTLPAGPDGGGTYSAGSGFGISSTCADVDAALEAVIAMTSEETLITLAEEGRAFPARTAAQDAWYDRAGIDGATQALTAAQTSAVPLPGSAEGDQLNQLLTQYAPQMLNAERPAAEVLADIAAQLAR